MPNESWIAIDEHTWRFEDRGVRFFLLEGSERAVLIDCGMTVHNALALARELVPEPKPVELYLTHADRDHIASLQAFATVHASPAEFVHPELRALTSEQLIPVWEGDLIDLGGRVLEAIAVPGHTPGSTAFLERETGRLFAGDPIQRDGRIFMFGAMRSIPAYIASLERLAQRATKISEIWPCHATCPIGPETIVELIEAAKQVERNEVPYDAEEMHGTPIRAYRTQPSVLLCDA